MVVSLSLVVLVFTISINSGECYSDDFPLFLAVVGMSGLYLEPRITKLQIILADVLLVVMYLLHPEKAESKSQYIMCMVIFTVAALTFFLTIRRGRAFIEISEERAAEAEQLLNSIRAMGEELERDFVSSSSQIEGNTKELQRGSALIIQGTDEVSGSCDEAQDRIVHTEQQIHKLNEGVRDVERALNDNQNSMEAMNTKLTEVSSLVKEANEIFGEMERRMKSVSSVAAKLKAISFNTTILSLNAAIEASRAGSGGVGFAVVAEQMRSLSAQSNTLSQQVEEVVKQMSEQVERTSQQFAGSAAAMEQSEERMKELQDSFGELTQQFGGLYFNIAEQNESVAQVNTIFERLHEKVAEMQSYTLDNQEAVAGIVDAMGIYKENITSVIEQTKEV